MTLKDAVNETMREWTNRMDDTHYVLGSVMGPHPFPTIVRDFQSVISKEVTGPDPGEGGAAARRGAGLRGRRQQRHGDVLRLHRRSSRCGSSAARRRAAGVDTDQTRRHHRQRARLGIFHGMKSYFCQDEYGQIAPVYSISAGLDYPGIGPEHAMLHDIGRAEYVPVTDDEAVDAFEYLSRTEGIIPRHRERPRRGLRQKAGADHGQRIRSSSSICPGRGDKDVAAIARYRGSGDFMSKHRRRPLTTERPSSPLSPPGIPIA